MFLHDALLHYWVRKNGIIVTTSKKKSEKMLCLKQLLSLCFLFAGRVQARVELIYLTITTETILQENSLISGKSGFDLALCSRNIVNKAIENIIEYTKVFGHCGPIHVLGNTVLKTFCVPHKPVNILKQFHHAMQTSLPVSAIIDLFLAPVTLLLQKPSSMDNGIQLVFHLDRSPLNQNWGLRRVRTLISGWPHANCTSVNQSTVEVVFNIWLHGLLVNTQKTELVHQYQFPSLNPSN